MDIVVVVAISLFVSFVLAVMVVVLSVVVLSLFDLPEDSCIAFPFACSPGLRRSRDRSSEKHFVSK